MPYDCLQNFKYIFVFLGKGYSFVIKVLKELLKQKKKNNKNYTSENHRQPDVRGEDKSPVSAGVKKQLCALKGTRL